MIDDRNQRLGIFSRNLDDDGIEPDSAWQINRLRLYEINGDKRIGLG